MFRNRHDVPGAILAGHVAVEAIEAAEADRHTRYTAALRLVHRALLTESLKPEAERNPEVVNVCLDLRTILLPTAPGVPSRPPVPVIPGGGHA